MAVDARGFQLVPDIAKAIQGGIKTASGIQQFQARGQALQNQEQLRALTGRVLAGGEEAQFAKEQLQTQFPQESLKLEQQQANLVKAKVANLDAETQSQLKNFTQRVAFANTLPQDQIIPHLEDEIQKGTQAGRDMSDTQELVDNLKTNPLAGARQAQETIKFGQQLGFIGETKADIAKAEAAEGIVSEVQSSKILAGGLVQLVRKDGTVEVVPAAEADAELVKQAERRAAELQGLRATEREEAKGKVKLKFQPQIEKAVVAARTEAKNRGEVFNELSQAKAALPSLTSAIDELRELSQVATSTFGGKVFDAAIKETGFGSTKGATARAKFIAIINNQVLPLLKPTFGAAFTVQEGESLKATMGDPDASPEQKMAQLDAFITQKLRDIETKQAQLTLEPQDETVPTAQPQVIRFDRTGKRIQ